MQRPLALSSIELIDAAGNVDRLDVSAVGQSSWHLLPEGNLGPP